MTLEQQLREAVASELIVWFDLSDNAGEQGGKVVMSTRFPPACNTCHGSGTIVVGDGFYEGAGCHDEECPDCPTLGQLLLWGVNVARAVVGFDDKFVNPTGGSSCFTPAELLAALRGELA